MPNQVNYQKELDKVLAGLGKERPTLLLHSCCAPCSSYVLEYLRQYFQITVFYYNPNISFETEYRKRVEEQKRLIDAYNKSTDALDFAPIRIIEGDYEPQLFYELARGREDMPEGGERCFDCYRLRLEATASLAAKEGFDFFGTTLTISPLKNAAKLNEIGLDLQRGLEAKAYSDSGSKTPQWLLSDFKKKNGYKRSVELSAEYDLYRQDYCGCVYSKRQREGEKA